MSGFLSFHTVHNEQLSYSCHIVLHYLLQNCMKNILVFYFYVFCHLDLTFAQTEDINMTGLSKRHLKRTNRRRHRKKIEDFTGYQTSHFSSGFIGEFFGQLYVSAKNLEFDTAPKTLNLAMECSSTRIAFCKYSGV